MKLFRYSFLAFAITLASPQGAFAQDSRAILAQRIATAQGLVEIFEQQIIQQRGATQAYAKQVFEQAVAEAGGQPNPRELAALERFVAKCSELFSAKEIVAGWVAHYGQDMSTQDLEDILRYYESPVGRKDVAATKAAMPVFSAWMSQESQRRSASLISELVAELKDARP